MNGRANAKMMSASQHARLALAAASWQGAGPRNQRGIDASITKLEEVLAELKRLRAASEGET